MSQQRQTITETRYPIDQTIPHQLVVSKILGALMCHPAFRIIQHEGQRPFVTPTDSLADLRGACDIAVSLDGSMKYGVVIEAKTTAHSEGGAWKIFKAVREEKRNALQFERLVNAAPRWWYLIVRTDKLTAKTHEEHDRNLLDCPAILVDGKQGDQVPEDFIGPLRFGEMLQFLGDRLHISSSTPIKTPSREQLAFPIDDVPAVTMEMPLQVMISKKPTPTPPIETPITPIERPRKIPSEGIENCLIAIASVDVSVDEIKSRMSEDELSEYNNIVSIISKGDAPLDMSNKIRAMIGHKSRRNVSVDVLSALKSEVAILSLAVYICRHKYKKEIGVFPKNRHRIVFAEFYFGTPTSLSKNIAYLVAHRFLQES